jgi:uncharacterized protein (DUF305 family)
MKNTNILYGAVGLLVGIILASVLSPNASMDMHSDHDDHGAHDMAGMMHDMNAALKGKTGAEFDKAFLSEMIVHHEGAVEMAEQVIEKSERSELRQLANEIISAQNKEIEMMQKWQKEWFTN